MLNLPPVDKEACRVNNDLCRNQCTHLEGCGITMDILRVIHRTRSNNVLAVNRREIHIVHQLFTKGPTHTLLSTVRRKQLPPAELISLELLDAEGKGFGVMALPRAWEHIKLSETPSHLAQIGADSYRIRPLKVIPDEKTPNKQGSTM